MPSEFNIDDFERLSKVGEGNVSTLELFVSPSLFSYLSQVPMALSTKSVTGQRHRSMH